MPNDAGVPLVLHVSESAARVPGLVESSSAPGGLVRVARDGAELPRLEKLHDDAKAAAVYSAQRPGVAVSGGADRLELVGRLADWAHGGDVNPPPLTAIRIASFEGLEPAQLAAMVSLAVSEMLFVEQQQGVAASSASRLKTALEQASAVANDPRTQPDCRTPCRPWPWQTVWSVLTTSARAKWQLGARLKDTALLAQSAELVRRALNVIPETHSLTTAVSQRLLSAVIHSIGDLSDDDAVLAQSLTASERALSGFSADRYRYDWALTQANILKTLSSRAERSASPGAVAAALAVSDRVLSVFDQRTPNLRAQALLERARLLQSRWARSGDPHDLTEAVRLAQQAAATSGATAETLVIAVALRRCDLESELASGRDDLQGLKQAVAQCEHLLNRPSLPEAAAPEAHRSYGLALGRLASEVGDPAMIGRAVEQLERAIEGADRIDGKRAGIKAQADYVWGLIKLSGLTSSIEAARKATSVISKALEPISKQAAPLAWGQMKQLQGSALMSLGMTMRAALQVPAAAEFYEQARAAFVEALGSVSKDENPKRWAALQGRIGATFAWQGEIGEPQRYLLNQAVASYQRALTVVRRQDDPDGFGHAQLGLGSAYLIWADQAVGRAAVRDPAQRAAVAFRTALDAFQQAGNVKSIANTKAHLADTLDMLQRVAGAPTCEAMALRLSAVAAYPRAHGPWHRAREALDRSDRAKFDWKRCPEIPATLRQQATPPVEKP